MLGGNSWVVGAEDGTVSGWFARAGRGRRGPRWCARTPSSRRARRSSALGAVRPRAQLRDRRPRRRRSCCGTRPRSASWRRCRRAAPVSAVLITPKADGLADARKRRRCERYALDNPHPEISWKTLFGKVWYEGYAAAGVRLAVDRRAPTTSSRSSAWCRSSSARSRARSTRCCSRSRWPCSAALYTSQFVAPDAPRRRSSRRSRSWRRCPASSSASSPACTSRRVVERNLVAGAADDRRCCRSFGTSGVLLWRPLPRARARPAAGRGRSWLLIVPLLLARRLGRAAARARRSRAALFGGDFAALARSDAWASPTTSATAWWSASRWASPSSRSSSRSPRTRSRACRRA